MAVCFYSTLVPPLVPGSDALCPVFLHLSLRTLPEPAGGQECGPECGQECGPECAPERTGRNLLSFPQVLLEICVFGQHMGALE